MSNPPSINIIQKHIWQNEPWLDPENPSSDVVIIDPLLGKDMLSDDAHIQQIIDDPNAPDKIFLPRGIYYIDEPLVLKENTQLFGPDKMLSLIIPKTLADNAQNFMITTINDRSAQTSLSNIMLRKNNVTHQNVSFVHWQAGQHSVVRLSLIHI